MTALDSDSQNNNSLSFQSTSGPQSSSLRSADALSDTPPVALKDIRPLFNRVYKAWSQREHVDKKEMSNVNKHYVTVDDFVRLTESRELHKYIALINNRIRFDEIPLKPHGQIISYLTDFLSEQFQTNQPGNVLYGAADNGMASYSMLTMADVPLNRGLKRPDLSYSIRPRAQPDPAPNWILFRPDGEPYPNLVVEVAVNHESPTKLMEDCHRYFHNSTSIRVWIGIKVWIVGRKFWVGWGERNVAGNRALIHTSMRLPPHCSSIQTPVNLVYHIPMATVYGPGIAMPPNSPATLDIDCDALRLIVLEFS
jgi:Uma2 family endonuclease